MSACMIDGKRCSRCCDAIVLQDPVAPDDNARPGSDQEFILANWTRITVQEAVAINPYLPVGAFHGRLTGDEAGYYSCKHSTPEGCAVYEDRPQVCRGYPGYGYGDEAVLIRRTPEYNPRCTQYPGVIPFVLVE